MAENYSLMVKIDGDAKGAEEAAKKTEGALSGLQSSIEKSGKMVQSTGKALSVGVTAPIMGLAAASKKAWNEVDEAMDTVALKTGAMGDTLDELQSSVEAVATSIPASFEEAGTAVGEVNTRFGLMGKDLEDLSSQFVKFAQINGVDLNSSIDQVQAAMAAFGVETKDASLFLDTLNKAGQDTGVNVLELAGTMQKNSAALIDMGMSAADAAMFTANLNKSGLDTGAVMVGMRNALKNAAAEGISSGEYLKQFSERIAEMNTEAEITAAGIEAFGAKSGAAIAAAVQDGRLAFENFGSSLETYAGNVGNAFDTQADGVDNMAQAMNQLKIIGADLTDAAMPMLVDIIGQVSEGIKQLKGWWDGLNETQQQNVVKFAAVAAAIGPVLTVVGTLITSISSIIGVFQGLGGAIAGVAGAGGFGALVSAAAPFLVGGAIIVGVGAGIGYIITHFEDVKKVGGQVASWLLDKWKGLVDFFKNIGDNLWSIWDNMRNGGNGLSSWAASWFDGIIEPAEAKYQQENREELRDAYAYGYISDEENDWWNERGNPYGYNNKSTTTRATTGGTSTTNNSITVNAAPGQNEEEIARAVERRLVNKETRRTAAQMAY